MKDLEQLYERFEDHTKEDYSETRLKFAGKFWIQMSKEEARLLLTERWIPVGERLPEERDIPYQCFVRWDNGVYGVVMDLTVRNYREQFMTHWKEINKPYK